MKKYAKDHKWKINKQDFDFRETVPETTLELVKGVAGGEELQGSVHGGGVS